jgi:glutamine synthetase
VESWLAGLLAHARARDAHDNGYKRYRPYSLAPDRIIWGKENRGALLRGVGRPGDAHARIENRAGEPAANPYLYFASQVYSGLDGLERKLTPPPSADTPYEAKAEFLPRTLGEALACLKEDEALCAGLGKTFIDYYCRIKEAEIARANLEVAIGSTGNTSTFSEKGSHDGATRAGP